MMFDMISPEEVDIFRYRPDVWLIDLRSEEVYQKEHIDGAYSVPYERLSGGKIRLPENGLLILYCERGPTSFAAARDLAAQGYRVCVLVGGIRAWRKYRDRRGRG